MNSLPRWLISITDMPDPCQSSISAAACASTSSGRTAGPALKLKIRVAGLLPILFVLSRHDVPLTRAPFAPCPGRAGGRAGGFFLRAQQPPQSLVDRAIVWKGVRDGRLQNHDVGRFSDPR